MTSGGENRGGTGTTRAIAIAGGLLAASLLWVFVVVPRWGTLPIVRSIEPGHVAAVEHEPPVPVERVAPPNGARWVAKDGVVRDGALIVATADALIMLGADGAPDHVRSWSRPAGAAITAVVPWTNGGVVVGAADGSLTFVGESSAELVRIEGAGPVVDLARVGTRLVVATAGGGLITLDGDHARRAEMLSDGTRIADLTALAADTRVALGSADGVVVAERAGRLERWAHVDGRVTAIGWQDGHLLVGTARGVARVDASGRHEPLAQHLEVTALLASSSDGTIYVGTPDGVVVLGGGSSERRLLSGERIERVRLVGGRPLAFGSHGVWDLASGEAIRTGS